MLLLATCRKRDDSIYLDTLNKDNNVNVSLIDTFTLLTSTIREDSLRTDSLSNNLLGIMNDPEFGISEARIYTQLTASKLNKVLTAPQEVPDSAILTLVFTSSIVNYGNLSSAMSLKVFELTEAIQNGQSYFSNQTLAYDFTPIGSWNGIYNFSDSQNIKDNNKFVKIAPCIKIKLTNEFVEKLAAATSADVASQESFRNYIKGLAFISDIWPGIAGYGNIVPFNLLHPSSKITLYYNDSLQMDYTIGSTAKRVNSFHLQSQTSKVATQKINPNSNFDTTYVQSLALSKTWVRFPYIYNLEANGPVVINKAELTIKILSGTASSQYPAPSRLLIFQPEPNTRINYPILDLFEFGFGGSYNSVNQTYTFNVTRHIQQLLLDKRLSGIDNNKGLYIVIPSDFPITASRGILDTRKGLAGQGISLKVYYTKLN